MTKIFRSAIPGQHQKLLWVIAALGVYWLSLIYQLGAQWSVYEQYNYGWGVPFLCVYLLLRRIYTANDRRQLATGVTNLASPNFQLPTSISYLLLALCALLYGPTRFFQEANPIWRLTSWLWTVEVIGLTLVLLHFTFRDLGEEGFLPSTFRFADFIFPVGFFLVAVPWPSAVEGLLVQTFTHLNVTATVEVLGMIGVPALQHGNVIEVATGVVGIDEACSGIRSFQATLMIALFFGDFYRLKIRHRAMAVGTGFIFAFLFNVIRTTLLTWVAARKSPSAVASWHDPAGVTILVACFLALWLVSVWLAGKPQSRKAEAGSGTTDLPAPNAAQANPNSRSTTVRWLAIALIGWFVLVEAGTELWFHLHETTVSARKEWSLNVAAAGFPLTPQEIPSAISGQFKFDNGLQASGQDGTGDFWQLYYFRWFPSHSLKNRVAVQMAKTHGPEKCLPAIGMTLKNDLGVITLPVGDRQFTLRQFLFLADGHPLYVFYAIYEDPTGSTVLANRRQTTASRLAAALAGSRNDGQRFLEVAVTGPETPAAAQIAVQKLLEKIIVPGR